MSPIAGSAFAGIVAFFVAVTLSVLPTLRALGEEIKAPDLSNETKDWQFFVLPDPDRVSRQIAQDVANGMKAASAQDWPLTIRYLEAARENEPPPPVLFNLALAYDRARVHPLAVVAQYRAYLAVAGEVSNAGRIRERVATLLADNLDIIQTLARNTERLAVSARTVAVSIKERRMLGGALGKVAFAHILIGDESEAERIRAEVAWHDDVRDAVSTKAALAFCVLNDFKSAGRWLKKLIDPGIRRRFVEHNLCARTANAGSLAPGYFDGAMKNPLFPLMSDRRRDNWHRYIRFLGNRLNEYDPGGYWKSVKGKPDGELALLLAERLSLLAFERSGYRLRDEGWKRVYEAFKKLKKSR